MSVGPIFVGSDHAGFPLKQALLQRLKEFYPSETIVDLGCHSTESVDYPTYAEKVADEVSRKDSAKGILICGTGIGMCIAANKVKGIRAASSWNVETAKLCREHNDSNIICLAGRLLSQEEAWNMVRTFLATSFLGGRHANRVAMIEGLEEKS